MATSQTISGGGQFPESTSVGAYPRSAWGPEGVIGAPTGSATDAKTVTNGQLAFTGLADNTDYVAYAQVGGVDRFRRFSTREGTLPSSESGRGLLLGDSTGTDDTASIQAALNLSTLVRGRVGQTYLISAPLVIPSGTTLDMTGATVRLINGSNSNLLNNPAVAAVKRTLGATITGGALGTLTIVADPLTATFAAGDVGKTVTIQGAGLGGGPLTTTISAFNSATSVALTTAASGAVSGQYAAIGPRDSNIAVIGGTWDRQANTPGANQTTAHLMRFRHVDGLTVRDATIVSTAVGSKYGINPGDCTDIQITRPRVAAQHYSDLVHLNGPIARCSVRDAYGDLMGDDLVSMTARDSTATITDCAGDITDVLVDGAYKAADLGGGLTACVLKVVAGKTTDSSASYNVRGVRARNLAGNVTTASVAYIGDTAGGNITDTVIDGVRSLGGSGGTLDTVYLGGAVVDQLTVRRAYADATDRACVLVSTNVTAGGRVRLEDCVIPAGHTATTHGVLEVNGVIAQATLDGCVHKGGSGGALLLLPNGLTPKPAVTRAIIVNSHLEVATGGSGAGIVRSQDSGATLATVEIANVLSANANYTLGFLGGTTLILARNVRSEGASLSSWVRAGAAAVLTIDADGMVGALDGVTIDAGGVINSRGFGLKLDIGTTGLAKTVGDRAYNTNAARATGVGPVVSDGTSWKGLFSGATF